MSKTDELYEKIRILEKDREGYLEVDDKAGARRKAKRIENIELQLELLNLDKIKKELQAYKKVCSEYPDIQNRVRAMLDT